MPARPASKPPAASAVRAAPRSARAALALQGVALAAFAALLAWHAADPPALVFDEVHYIPAAKALAHLSGDLNWEHPPLSKWILGLGGWIFSERLGLVSDPAIYRLVTAAFGLWALWTIGGILRDVALAPWAALCATVLTGANLLWFVQSRTAMPDVFAVAFALAGVRRVWRGGAGASPWIGWALLGLAMACKWSAAPLCVIAALASPLPLRTRAAGVAVAVAAYAVPFLPLALLRSDATPPWEIVGYQLRMLDGFARVDLSTHPYASRWWQWPTLLRPIWYHFEDAARSRRCVWAGGNPLLFACALPATVWVGLRALRREASPAERAVALLYWAPLAFWAVLPRVQLFYYFLPSSLWLGPAVVVALRAIPRPGAGRAAAVALTAACFALFLWFLPVLDGRHPCQDYGRYMWLLRWR